MYLPAGVWCHGDLDPWYQHNPFTTAPRQQTASSGRRLLLFPVPVHLPLFASHHLISMPISSHCLSYHFGHRTLVYNLRNSIVLSLRPPLLVLGCRTPALHQDQVVAWRCSVHGDLRPPPTLIPFCNVNSPSLQLWRILYSQVDEAGQTARSGAKSSVRGEGKGGMGVVMVMNETSPRRPKKKPSLHRKTPLFLKKEGGGARGSTR